MIALGHRALRDFALGLCAMSVAACCCPPSYAGFGAEVVSRPSSVPSPGAATPVDGVGAPADSVTEAQFRGVDFHVGLGVVLGIRHLRGEMTSTTHGGPVDFDDKRSFVIRIDTADVALSSESLSHLMNRYVFAYRGAPLRNLSFTVDGTRLKQRGVLHKRIDIPFEMTASLSVTPDGRIRIHPTAMKICSLDGTGLMRALRIELADLVDLSKAVGVAVDGNDLLLDPNRALPPPAIRGRVVAVRLEGDQVVQTFGRANDRSPPAALVPSDTTAPNYIYFRGGTLRFGKLFMVQSDMQLVDLDPRTPFAFSIDDYQQQLVAGYSKTLADLGLKVFMPDYSSVAPSRGDRP